MHIPVCKTGKLWRRNAEEFVPDVPLITNLPPITSISPIKMFSTRPMTQIEKFFNCQGGHGKAHKVSALHRKLQATTKECWEQENRPLGLYSPE